MLKASLTNPPMNFSDFFAGVMDGVNGVGCGVDGVYISFWRVCL